MVFCADPKKCGKDYGLRGEELFCIQDITISCVYAQITTHSLGLSSVWIGSFDEDKVSQILHIEDNLKSVAILPIGISGETPEITHRSPMDEIVHSLQL